MAGDVDSEIKALQEEYNWLLREEVHNVLLELQAILGEACKRFPIQINTEDDSVANPEKFLLTSSNGGSQIKCVVTLLADHICEADLTLRINKQQTTIVNTKIYPDMPWRVQQIQDAGNHLLHALAKAEAYETDYQFKSGQEVTKLLDSITEALHRGRSCLALPKKRTLEDLVRNPTLKAFKPQLPNDVIVSFYVQAQKLILAVYQLYVNPVQKIDIQTRHQVECSVPWLNDALVMFTLALQQIQQLQDKLTVFQHYAAETKFLETTQLNLTQTAPYRLDDTEVPSAGFLLGDEEISTAPYESTHHKSKDHYDNEKNLFEISIKNDDHLPNPCARTHATNPRCLSEVDVSLAKPPELVKKNSLAHAKPHLNL